VIPMTRRGSILCVVIAFCLTTAVQARWTTTEQPDLASQIENAPTLEVETLSQPARTIRMEAPVIVPNADGKTADILVIYYRSYTGPSTVFAVDTGTGSISRAEVPQGRNVHLQATAISPNGKLYATFQRVGGGLELWVFEPATNVFEAKTTFGKDLDLMGQTNHLTLGPDGQLYGTVGSRKNGEAAFYRIESSGDAVTILGTGGDLRGAPYAGTIRAASDGKLYAVYGKTPYKLIEFDPTSKSGRILATANPRGGISIPRSTSQDELAFAIRQPESGAEQDGMYALRSGLLVRTGDVSAAAPSKLKGAAAGQKTSETDKEVQTSKRGKQRTPEAAESTPGFSKAELMRRKKAAAAKAAQGNALGASSSAGDLKSKVRAPSGVARHCLVEVDASRLDPFLNPDNKGTLRYGLPGQGNWTQVKLDPPTYPEAITQLATLPDGRVFGTAANRSGHFVHDPATDKTTFLGRTGLQHQSSAISADSIFLSGYPSSMLWEYDFTKPWQADVAGTKGRPIGGLIPNQNPRPLGTLREHSGVHMATCAATDSKGRLYFAGRWYRDGQGGGVGWWNPKTQAAGGFWKELSNLQVVDCKAVGDRRYIVLSTLAVPDQVLKKDYPDVAQLCVIDTTTDNNVIAKRIAPIDGGKSTGLIAPAGGSRLIGIAPFPQDNSIWLLYGLDVESGKVAFTKKLPGIPEDSKVDSAGLLHSYRSELVNAPDGSIWMKHLGVLLRIDPKNAHVVVVGRPVRSADATEGVAGFNLEDRKTVDSVKLIKAVGAPATVGCMTFSGRDLYLGGTSSLRRIRGILGSTP